MNCSWKDCAYPGEFYLVGLMPGAAKRGDKPWTDAIYCKTHTMTMETRYSDLFPLGKTPAAIMRIGVVRRVNIIEGHLERGADPAFLQALLRALRMYVENSEGVEHGDESL